MTDPEPEELASFDAAQQLEERLLEASGFDTDAFQFARDCDAILAEQSANAGSGRRNYLPMVPLLRLARAIGLEQVRYIEELARPAGHTRYHLKIAVRAAAVRRHEDRKKRADERIRLQVFGNRVLELEQRGCRRWEALVQAGHYARMDGGGRRYLELQFRKFEAGCRAINLVANSRALAGRRPRFALKDLKAKQGRTRKSAHDPDRRAVENDLVFPPFKR